MFPKIVALNLILYGLICCLTCSTFAATGRGTFHSSASPGKCALKDFKLILGPGQSADLPHCGVISCLNAKGVATFETCRTEGARGQCRIKDLADEKPPYTKCGKPKIV